MYRCTHCGNEYQEEKEQCPTCGGRKFAWRPRDLPLRTIYKGTKPPPKPLPPPLPLERTYKGLMPRDGIGPVLTAILITAIVLVAAWFLGAIYYLVMAYV